MTDTKRLRVGVIGCGGIAQMMHLPHLEKLHDQFEIAALSDISPGVLQRIGARYQVPAKNLYANFQDLVGQDLDAVLILTGGNHHAQIISALNAGKHVFVEKPMAYTVQEADEEIELARKMDRKLFVGYMKRFDPGYRYAQKLIHAQQDIRYVQINTLHPAEEGYIGHHRVVRFQDVPSEILDPLIQADDASARQAVGNVSPILRETYTNVLLGSMVHDVNALRGLLGEPERVSFTQLWPADERDVCITTALDYPNNARVIVTWAYLADLRDYFEEIAVMSSANRIRIQFPSPFLRNFPTPVVVQGMEDGAEFTKRVVVSYEEAFHEELGAFHNCVVNDTPSPSDGESARNDILVLEKIFAKLNPEGLGGEAANYV
jgi:predicted dehydrogenase